jgi:predicted ester cyclase
VTAKAEDIIAEGDKVVGRFTVTGTHKGKFMDFEPTGNAFTYDEMVIVRFKDGKIVEHWAVTDVLSMMQQIGAIPS